MRISDWSSDVCSSDLDRTISFDFPKPDPLSPPLLALEGVKAGYGDKVVLSGLNQRIDMDDRIALLGANGNGKSTFVKLLAGRLPALSGAIRKSAKLKVRSEESRIGQACVVTFRSGW